MFTTQRSRFLPGLALAMLLVAVCGCGRPNSPPQIGAGDAPDRVQIAIHPISPQPEHPVVTLTDSLLVRGLYSTIAALPILPENISCVADMGPSYVLTFLKQGKLLARVTALRYGCGNVIIGGDNQDRGANEKFWSQLDQAIFEATPIAEPGRLAILHRLQLDQPPETALLTSVSSVQGLYQAILKLPSAQATCTPESLHHYELVFDTTSQAIPAELDQKCHTISLEGNYQSRSGTFLMNAPFEQLLEQTLAAAAFAPAQPDKLEVEIQAVSGAAAKTVAAGPRLGQQLYTKTFALPTGTPPPNCPSGADKIAGKGTWYTLDFTQWSLLTVIVVSAYSGSCTLVSLNESQGASTSQVLQSDGAFWDLVHQVASPG